MEINKGDTLFFKGKYGMYYEVTVCSVQGDYAFVKGSEWGFGNKKVRIDKLRKKPSKEFEGMSRKTEKELKEAQEMLWRAKERN